MTKEKQLKKPRRMIGALVIVAGIALCMIVGVVWAIWYDMNIGFAAPAHPDFKGYTSSLQLNGNSLKTTELIRYTEYGLGYWWFDYTLRYDSDIVVYERSATKYPDTVANCRYRVNGKDGDYDRTCDVYTIKDGGRYAVMTDAYEGKIFSITVEALVGTTKLYINIPHDQLEHFAAYDGWQAYFDSLTHVNLQNTPFTIKTHHQGMPKGL